MQHILVWDGIEATQNAMTESLKYLDNRFSEWFALNISRIHNRALIWLPKEKYTSRLGVKIVKNYPDQPDNYTASMKVMLVDSGLVIMSVVLTNYAVDPGVTLEKLEQITPAYVNLRAGFDYVDAEFRKFAIDAMEDLNSTSVGLKMPMGYAVQNNQTEHPGGKPFSRMVWAEDQQKPHVEMRLLNKTAMDAAQSTLPSKEQPVIPFPFPDGPADPNLV